MNRASSRPGQHQDVGTPATASRAPRKSGGARREATVTDPVTILRRARRLGHGSRHLFPASPTPSPATADAGTPTVRRKVFLANADQNIYQDTDLDIELSYLKKTGKNRPLFLKYSTFQELQDEIQNAWNTNVVAAGLDGFWTKQKYASEYLRRKMKKEYGLILTENSDGELERVDLNEHALLHALSLAATEGPRYWNRGGGSRLPRAEGYLVSNGLELSAVLKKLGLPEKKFKGYKNVQFKKIDDVIDYMRLWEKAKQADLNLLDGDNFFYVSTVTLKRSKRSRVTAAGVSYKNDDFRSVTQQGGQLLAQSLQSLTSPQTQDWDDVLTPRNRGDGQMMAMGKWNALGAAAFVNKAYGRKLPLDQNWEWLHVRGAQVGGATEGGNLVPGLFATNSAMIPYEAQIAKWSQKKGSRKVSARFEVGNVRDTVFTDKIVLKVAAEDHPELGTIPRDDPATVEFDPLHGKVVDKMAGRIHKARWEQQVDEKATEDEESSSDDDLDIVMDIET